MQLIAQAPHQGLGGVSITELVGYSRLKLLQAFTAIESRAGTCAAAGKRQDPFPIS